MRAVATVVCAALAGSALIAPPALAQPAPPSQADLERARSLYLAAEQALKEGRHADAIRDYGATFELTRDPVLFYKIGIANERAGKCDVALIYYGRYVKEGRPSARYLELVRERVTACGGDPHSLGAGGAAATTTTEPTPPATTEPTPPATAPGEGPSEPGDPPPPTPTGLGATSVPQTSPVGTGANRGAWLMVTGSLAFLTVGAVLAYAAESAENDISDLYVGFNGRPPDFDASTRAVYDDLVAEGRRYEKLSWIAFGAAVITGVGAGVLFATAEQRVQVVPTVAPQNGGVSGGVSASLRW